MSRQARTWSPLVAAVAAIVAALAMMTDASDPSVPLPDRGVAAPGPDLFFMADRFEEQKRNAPGDDLPSQF